MPVHYLAARGGGAEYQVQLLLEHIYQKKKNYEIHFLCRRTPEQPVKNQFIWKIGSEEGLSKYWTFIDFKRIYRTLRKIKPDLIYQNVGCAHTGIAAWYAMYNNSKLIWHIASDFDLKPDLADSYKSRIISSIDRIFLNYGIKKSHLIAGQTMYQSKLLKQKFARVCDAFVPIGHPLPEEVAEKGEKVRVLWVASLKPLKQPEIFTKLAILLSNRPNVEFVMMGHPSTGKWFSGILEKIKSVSNLRYVGLLSQDEVNKQLSEGHILVNTSRYEGFSNTFIQAWMREVPVVSLNVDPDDILIRKKIGFHSRNFGQLINDVRTLVSDTALRNRMGKKARQYALENHTIDKMAESLISLFDSTL
jgi:glycosyltransferase involved in cell wall biosynthesis